MPLGGYLMKNWVILFVKTGSEDRLMRILKEKLNTAEYLPFLPLKEMPYRKKGIISKKRELLFPSYIFIQTEIEANLVAEKLELALMNIAQQKDIYSILNYGNKKDIVIRENECLYWEHFFNSDFCAMGSVGFIEGDVVRITSGALVGMESRIKKINRHKREAIVELEIMGAIRKVSLMLEIIKKI